MYEQRDTTIPRKHHADYRCIEETGLQLKSDT